MADYATKLELADYATKTELAALSSIFATKAELPAVNFSITTLEGSPCLLVTDGTTTYKFVGAEVIDGG